MSSGSEYVSYRLLHPSEDDEVVASATPTPMPARALRLGLMAQAHARFRTHREFMQAAAYCWPAVQPMPRLR